MSFILKGSQISALQFKGLVQIQDVDARVHKMKYRTRIKLVHELYGTCFQYNVNQESRIDHLTLLLVVTMSYACGFLWSANYNILRTSSDVFYLQFGVTFQKVVLREVYMWRAKSRLKGIEGFNLELQILQISNLLGIPQSLFPTTTWSSWVEDLSQETKLGKRFAHLHCFMYVGNSCMNSIGSLVHLNQCYSSNSLPFMHVASSVGWASTPCLSITKGIFCFLTIIINFSLRAQVANCNQPLQVAICKW